MSIAKKTKDEVSDVHAGGVVDFKPNIDKSNVESLPPLSDSEFPNDKNQFSKLAKKKPQSLRKAMMLLALVIITMVGAGLFIAKQGNETSSASLSAETTSKNPLTEIGIQLSDRVTAIEAILKEQSNVSIDVNAIRSELDGIKQTVSQFSFADQDLHDLRMIAERAQNAASDAASRISKLERDRQREAEKRESNASSSATSPSGQKPENISLPFRAISIDIWAGKPYVALALPGAADSKEMELLTIGDRRSGWEVKAIDVTSRRIEYIDETGRIASQRTEER